MGSPEPYTFLKDHQEFWKPCPSVVGGEEVPPFQHQKQVKDTRKITVKIH